MAQLGPPGVVESPASAFEMPYSSGRHHMIEHNVHNVIRGVAQYNVVGDCGRSYPLQSVLPEGYSGARVA